MFRRARTGWWLALLAGTVSAPVRAQTPVQPQQQPAPGPKIELKENTPNPFFPSTTIPFTIAPEVCSRGHVPVVSLKVYNVLVQVVAIPVLPGDPPVPVDSLRLRCGDYRAMWDGKYLDGQHEVTPGVYYSQLTVDGQRFTRKMIVQRRVTSER
jgi:hypothetical protein